MENKVFRKNLSSSSGILCNRSFSSEDRVSQMTKTTATVTFHGHDRGAVVLKSRQPHGGHYLWTTYAYTNTLYVYPLSREEILLKGVYKLH